MVEESSHGRHERIDASMAVIAGNAVMELFPQPLDNVVIGRVRRQEVQDDAPAERLELA